MIAISLPPSGIAFPDNPLAEKLRAVIESINHSNIGKVTASFRVAEYYPDEYSGSWFKRVDQALYNAKEAGRNCVKASEIHSFGVIPQYRIKWLDEWSSGNNVIDQDHKNILRLGNQLVEDSYTINSLEEFISRYNELLDQITDHLVREESLLEKAHFPDLKEHKEFHQQLLKKVINFRDEMSDNKLDPQKLFEFILNEIVFEHLAKEDMKYINLITI